MKSLVSVVVFASLGSGLFAAGKLTFDDEVELIRGLTAESAKVKTYLPRSKKPVEYDASGKWDKQQPFVQVFSPVSVAGEAGRPAERSPKRPAPSY